MPSSAYFIPAFRIEICRAVIGIYPCCLSPKFLTIVVQCFSHMIQAIKTENHSIFTNYYLGTNRRSDIIVETLHALDQFCAEYDIRTTFISLILANLHRVASWRVVIGKIANDSTTILSKTSPTCVLQCARGILTTYSLEYCGLNRKTSNEMI